MEENHKWIKEDYRQQLEGRVAVMEKRRRFFNITGACDPRFHYFVKNGNFYVESRTRNMERTDVIVDYGGEQFVIEMKIWRGNAYHTRGEAVV